MRTLIFLFAFCLPAGLAAQVSIAPVAGAAFQGNTEIKMIPKAGIIAGLMADIKLKGHFYLQPAILYTATRYSYESHNQSPYSDQDYLNIRSNSVEAPLIVTYKTKQSSYG